MSLPTSVNGNRFNLPALPKIPKFITTPLRILHLIPQRTTSKTNTTTLLISDKNVLLSDTKTDYEAYGDEEEEEEEQDDDGVLVGGRHGWGEGVTQREKNSSTGGWEYGSRRLLS